MTILHVNAFILLCYYTVNGIGDVCLKIMQYCAVLVECSMSLGCFRDLSLILACCQPS